MGNFLEVFWPVICIGAGIAAGLVVSQYVGRAIIRAFRDEAFESQPLVLDQRKKKKDEYEAYYDERLADDQAEPLSDAVAYYEDASEAMR